MADFFETLDAQQVDLDAGTATNGVASSTLAGVEGVVGGLGDDTLAGRDAGDDRLEGWQGNDSLAGRGGNDSLFGGGGNDRIEAGAGDDFLTGDDGDDTLAGGAGADQLIGSTGLDWLDYRADTTGILLDFLAGTGAGGDAQGDIFDIVEGVAGGSGDDTILGRDDTNETMSGGAGADSLVGGASSADWLDYRGGTQGVSVHLAAGAVSGGEAQGDVVSGFEAAAGGSGDDTLVGRDDGDDTLAGGAGADSLVGAGGLDWLDYGGDWDGVTVNLGTGATAGGAAAGDAIAGFEAIRGGAGNDRLAGREDGGDTLLGGAGNDVLDGGDGADSLVGGEGVDSFVGGAGNDTIEGDFDLDVLDYRAATGAVSGDLTLGVFQDGSGGTDSVTGVWIVYSGGGDDTIGSDGTPEVLVDAGAGDDLLIFYNALATFAFGGDGNDKIGVYGGFALIEGGAGDDDIAASGGNDTVDGGDGADTILAAAGNDLMSGASGDDWLDGGLGWDTLDGGTGTDTADWTFYGGAVAIDIAAGTVAFPDNGTPTIEYLRNIEVFLTGAATTRSPGPLHRRG